MQGKQSTLCTDQSAVLGASGMIFRCEKENFEEEGHMFEGPDDQALAWPLCLTGNSPPQLLMWAGFRGYQLLREAEKVVWSCFQLPFHISIRSLAGRPLWLMLHWWSVMVLSLQFLQQQHSICLPRAAQQPHTSTDRIAAPLLCGCFFNCLAVGLVTFFSLFLIICSLCVSLFFFSSSECVRVINRNEGNALMSCRYWDDLSRFW